MKYFILFFLLNIFCIKSSYSSPVKAAAGGSLLMKDPGPDPELQKKIAAFWKKTRAELAAIPIDAKIETLKEPVAYRLYYITVRSLDNVTIAAHLAIPVKGEGPAKPWPLIVTTVGYSGRSSTAPLNECMRGYAVLQVYPRGQGESAKYFKIKSDKVSTNLDKPENFYYRGGYADMIRMIDYAVTRPDIDTSRIAISSGSQGGGIALAVAALDKRIKAVVAQVPFLCNFRLAATIPKSLVKINLDRSKTNNEASLQTLDYFDPLHLAPEIRVPVLMSAGGKDEWCPLSTIQSVYDQIPVRKKELKFYPDLPHTTCIDFYSVMWPWLDKNFRKK